MEITVWKLCQWLWIMVCYSRQEQVAWNHHVHAVPVGVNHGGFSLDSCCESRCAMLSQWLWIIVKYAEPVVVKHCELYWASGCESYCVMLRRMYGNHGVLCCARRWGSRCERCANGCESCCAIMSQSLEITMWTLCQWLWIMLCYSRQEQIAWNYHVHAVPVGVNHGEFCLDIWCESCCAILSKWLWIMAIHAVPVVVNHGESWCASGCESRCIMLTHSLGITMWMLCL
jgi:hypothetical protein